MDGSICLSTAERQSLASKARRNAGAVGERMGKKPDIMGLLNYYMLNLHIFYAVIQRKRMMM